MVHGHSEGVIFYIFIFRMIHLVNVPQTFLHLFIIGWILSEDHLRPMKG